MSRRPLVFRAVKWLGLFASVGMVMVWIASGWLSAHIPVPFRGGRLSVEVNAGCVWLSRYGLIGPDNYDRAIDVFRPLGESPSWNWIPAFDHPVPTMVIGRYGGMIPRWSLKVPLLIPLVFSSGIAWFVAGIDRRNQKRRAAGKCAVCGYDLQGISGRCPECGSPRGS